MSPREEHLQRQPFGIFKQVGQHILDLATAFVNVSIAPEFKDDLATIPVIGSHTRTIDFVTGEEGSIDAMLKSSISIKQYLRGMRCPGFK